MYLAFEIARDQLTANERGVLIGEASDLGLRPGIWPFRVVVDGQPFDWERKIGNFDEGFQLSAVQYRAFDGTVLHILND